MRVKRPVTAYAFMKHHVVQLYTEVWLVPANLMPTEWIADTRYQIVMKSVHSHFLDLHKCMRSISILLVYIQGLTYSQESYTNPYIIVKSYLVPTASILLTLLML